MLHKTTSKLRRTANHDACENLLYLKMILRHLKGGKIGLLLGNIALFDKKKLYTRASWDFNTLGS